MKTITHNLDCCSNCSKHFITAYNNTNVCRLKISEKVIDDPENTTCKHIDCIVK